MAEGTSQKDPRQALLEELAELGTRAFDPNVGPGIQAADRQAFTSYVERTRTAALLPALNLLIQPGRVPEWLRAEFMAILTSLPLRPDGVRATLEFVFSVHPSSTIGTTEASTPQKQGANITHEALKMAAQLLASPPAHVAAEVWFPGIAPQLLELLDGGGGDELVRVASYVIGFGILGRRSSGAPGAPGWVSVVEPMLHCIDPALNRDGEVPRSTRGSSRDGIIDLSRDTVIVSPRDLSLSLHRLQALIISHPNPGLTRRLLSPILLPLWALSSWRPGPSARYEDEYGLPARNLLKIYLKIVPSMDSLMPIIRNLVYNGPRDPSRLQWVYQTTSNGEIQITALRNGPGDSGIAEPRWAEVDPKADVFIDLLETISTADDISAIFLDLFGRWLASRKPDVKPSILIKEEEETFPEDPVALISEASILQKMMEKFPEKLVDRPDQILELVDGVLGRVDQPSAQDEAVPIALSLLNLVVTTPGFQKAKADGQVIRSIEASLDKISKDVDSDASGTARNLALFLKYRDEIEEEQPATPAVSTDQKTEDRKTYGLAMSYITQADSPPPVRSEGLNLIQGLIQANSPILDIPALLVLLSSLLEENEDYINLRVIKAFTQLADRHPRSVTRELLERYVDANESASVDARLRFGEALLQVIERLGETFAGEVAREVGEALLATAGRRGRRPKTEAKQAREERLRSMKKRQAEGALGGRPAAALPGPEGEEDDDDEDDSEDDSEKRNNEILNQIVQGWGSKRGSEDVRIRASALSVLAAAMDTNVAGLGAGPASSAVDLAVHILTLETGAETAILRRSAIVLVLAFVRALHAAREAGRRLGFGLTPQSQDDILRVLRYVGVTDPDGLVRQHAVDVVESLENWQMASLVPDAAQQAAAQQPGLTRLAGLSLNPGSGTGTGREETTRPKIEEIE